MTEIKSTEITKKINCTFHIKTDSFLMKYARRANMIGNSKRSTPMATNKTPVLFQTGTIGSLLQGIHDGELDIQTLAKHGDFGIGTFNAVDGELIALDEKFYRVDAEGNASLADLTRHTPFALVTFFEPSQTFELYDIPSYEELTKAMDAHIGSKNYIYAVRIDGEFADMKARSLQNQPKPYRPLAEVLDDIQTIFDYSHSKGTAVGFRFPTYMESLNVEGYHMHFLTEDRSRGGHLFETCIKKVTVQICMIRNFALHLPYTEFFATTPLYVHRDVVNAVERIDQPDN